MDPPDRRTLIRRAIAAEVHFQERREVVNNILRHPERPGRETHTCECTHICHEWEKDKLTPRGEVGHMADLEFFKDKLTEVVTPWGLVLACDRCVNDCLASYKDLD